MLNTPMLNLKLKQKIKFKHFNEKIFDKMESSSLKDNPTRKSPQILLAVCLTSETNFGPKMLRGYT